MLVICHVVTSISLSVLSFGAVILLRVRIFNLICQMIVLFTVDHRHIRHILSAQFVSWRIT